MFSNKSFRTLLLVSLITIGILPATAADYFIRGAVRDSIGEPESFATVRIYHLPDTSKTVVIGTADEEGLFSFKVSQPGQYRVNINMVGKAPVAETVTLSAGKPTADLGTVTTRLSSASLGEVTVTALRPVVIREIDRIGYDVQADEDSKTNQLDEMLKKVPLVSVDPDGTIRVKGSENFKVYKNGRPNNSYSQNAKEIFKAIPASMIKRIEVITDPGAREDAEGSSAILNIVTMENTSTSGVMGTASVNFDTHSLVPSPNLWLSSQIGKVNWSLYAGMHHRPARTSKQRSEGESRYDDSGNTMKTSSENKGPNSMGYFGLEASYDLDTLNLFTAEFGGWFFGGKSQGVSTTEMLDPQGSALYRFSERSASDPIRYTDFNGALNYQHSTHRKGETVTLSYQISTTSNHSKSESEYFDTFNMPVPYDGTFTDSREKFMEHTFQADWNRPFGEHHVLDLGGKYIYRDNHSLTDQDYLNYRQDHSDFSHVTQVAAAYLDYRARFGKIGYRAGIRYEFSRLAAKFKDGSADDFGSNLNDFVPNAAFSWDINDKNTLKLSYSTRISRPGIDYLNPAVIETPTTYSTGNPDLKSSMTHNVDLNYTLLSDKINCDFNASYSYSGDGIIDKQWTIEDVVHSSYTNGGRTETFYLSAYAQWTPLEKTTFSFNGSASYNKYNNKLQGTRNSGWDGWMMLRYTQKLPWNLRMTVHGSYWLGWNSLYSEMRPEGISAFNYGFNLQRSFLKEDRLTVRVGISNPFAKSTMVMKTTPKNSGYTGWSRNIRYYNANRFSLSVSYRFGSLRTMVKKVAREISNDDVVGGGGAQSQSGSQGGAGGE